MFSHGEIQVLAGLLLITAGVFCGEAFCQSFPYSVPQAPEFDSYGNSRGLDRQEGPPPAKHPPRRSSGPVSEKKHNYREVRPYAPQPAEAPLPPPPRPAVPGRYAPTPPPNTASGPPMGPPQAQERPDCSQYPMLIANAQSQQEMQMTARLYLTCLMKNGWGQDQAKQHVIATIESTQRAGR